MPVDTVGTELLRERFLTKAEVARRVGVSHQVVSDWVAGMKRPVLEHREILQREFGIPVEAWLTPDEREPKYPLSFIISEYMHRTQVAAADLLARIARKAL
jgi:transcriptional regulator with XRE-family HTH domain